MEGFDEIRFNLSYDNCSSNFSQPTRPPELPPYFTFNVLIQVIVYCVLFLIAAAGNLTVLITLIRGRHRKSRISLMIMHLTIADLMVTFIMIPLEIGWRITVQWTAGNVACKVFSLLRAFGLYLSSNVLVCVSMDRYFAILHPLRVTDARRRGKIMLGIAWIFSFLCASPQSVVFHVSHHPYDETFIQCVTFGFFSSEIQEMSYNLFCVSVMYFIPLIVIVFAYSCILQEVSTKSRETKEDNKEIRGRENSTRGRMRLRRSDMSNIARARSRTLRMTITIVVAFIWCWTPYVVMTLWYVFDRSSATTVPTHIQDGLFIMAVSNSCMNPIVYGSYAMNLRKDCLCFGNKYNSHNNLTRRSTMRSTATTRVTTLHNSRRGRFTFNTNNNDDLQINGHHSEAYLPADDDSGVSISFRGRPYHSDPPHQGVAFEMAFFRNDSLDEIIGHQDSRSFFKPNIRENKTNNRKVCS